MQLILEFCDRGDLRDALEAGVFRLHSRSPIDPAAATIPAALATITAAAATAAGPGPAAATASGPHSFPASAAATAGPIDYLSVLETAADIARGMAHLHACNIVHLDLKVLGGT